MKLLRAIRSDGFEPEIAFCINAPAKGDVASPNYPTTRPKAQARSVEQESHSIACDSLPRTTSDQEQCNSRGVRSKELKDGGRNLHSPAAFARASATSSLRETAVVASR